MKIGIVGLGAVGSANKDGFAHLGQEVLGHDISLDTKLEDLIDTEVCFLCVPTPSSETGHCDTSIVESVIEELIGIEYSGVIAVRSTVAPGFTQSMIDKYSNTNIAFVPEFLRERCALEDFIYNHQLLAIGSDNPEVSQIIGRAHGDLPKNSVSLSPSEAEILKYYNNVYASLRITFANVIYELCQEFDADYTSIKNAYIKTGKAKDMYLDVAEDLRGYGGMCLPKDTKALALLLQDLGLNFDLINSIDSDNEKFTTTVFRGMRA